MSSSKVTSLATPASPLSTPSPPDPTYVEPDEADKDKSPDSQKLARSSTQYTVTFTNLQGADIKQSVTDGKQAKRPDDPTKDGCLFDGWFNGDTPIAYDFSQPVTNNLTLKAHWTEGSGDWSIDPDKGSIAGNTKVTLTPPATRGIRFSQVSAGKNHSLALGSDGKLYTWGYNSDGQLGRKLTRLVDNRPGMVTIPGNAHATFVSVSAAGANCLAIDKDGNLYSWGNNQYGQLGRDTGGASTDQPGQVKAPSGIKFTQAIAGTGFSMAFGSDGNLYNWGDNEYGELGRPTDADNNVPVGLAGKPADAKPGFTWTQASAGMNHTLAMGSDGKLYSWGNNDYGQLGRDIGSSSTSQPGQVETPAGVTFTQAVAGVFHSMAIDQKGEMYSWGNNDCKQLGRDTTSTGSIPRNKPGLVGIPEGTQIVKAYGGYWFSMAMDTDGNLYTWGFNDAGELGRTASGSVMQPGKVAMPTNITASQAVVGNFHCLTIGSDGNLYTWGLNNGGQIGRGTVGYDAYSPGPMTFPVSPMLTSVTFDETAITEATSNIDGTWTFATPQHAEGWVPITVTWRLNTPQPDQTVYLGYTYIGTPRTITFDPANGSVANIETVNDGGQVKRPTDPIWNDRRFDGWFIKDANGDSKIAYDFSQPVTGDITLIAHWSPVDNGSWSISPIKGSSLGGQQVIIIPPTTSRGIRFNQISAGGSKNREMRGFSVGVASDGKAYAWGNNNYGQLGTGDNKQRDKPTEVLKPEGAKEDFTYTQISAGGAHTLAIGSDGILYSWGRNDFGQLGKGSTDTSSHVKPEVVINPSTGQPFHAIQVSAGACDSVAIDTTGKVYNWGSETTTLGDSINTANSDAKPKPTIVADPGGTDQGLHAVQVSANWSFIMALDAGGNIYTWGYNNWGQFGNGSSTNSTWTIYSSTPTLVLDPTDTSKGLQATRISAGAWHALAIGKDGTVWAWGMDNNGQLGFSTGYQTLPKQVPNLKAQQVSASTWNSLAISQDSKAWGWGNNANGQLGNGSTSNGSLPRPVSSPTGQGSTSNGFASVRISAGWSHSLSIGQDGNAYAWGNNQYSQLGNGSTTQSSKPTLVSFNPTLLITGVRFDKTAVDSLLQNPNQSVSLTTPAHNPGQADVIVDWTLGGIAQPQAHLAYTYEGMLPHAGSSGTLILLAAGMLAAAGSAAAGHHRRESRNLQS
ncbi:InlB B-repeat-containing protein [Bifidobacterium asteroides]|uniref:RCC1 domain-containing protein n=1 Tax=Bifidobacterium asteroides TaxID=1684 RepID=UPI003A7FCAD8